MAWVNLRTEIEAEFGGLVTLDVRGLSRHADMGFTIHVRYREYHAAWSKEDRRLNPGKYRRTAKRFWENLKADPERHARRLAREAKYRAARPPVSVRMREERPAAYAAKLAKGREYMREYNHRPEVIERRRARQSTPDEKAARAARSKARYERMRADPVQWAAHLASRRKARQGG